MDPVADNKKFTVKHFTSKFITTSAIWYFIYFIFLKFGLKSQLISSCV